MNPELSKQYIKEQFHKLQSLKGISEHHDWQITVQGFDIFVLMRPNKHPDKKFLLRLRCDDYPKRAPSLQFIDSETKQEGAQYWPQGGPFQAAISRSQTQPQLCIPGIREFHEGCHASDSSKPWIPEKYSFVKTLESTQILLNKAYP